MNVLEIGDNKFLKYGRVYTDFNIDEVMEAGKKTSIPEEGNVYIAADSTLENCLVMKEIRSTIFGEMPIQVGFCNGHNSKMNAMEYHKSSEVCIAVTDIILILGSYSDIQFLDDTTNKKPQWNSSLVDVFFVPKGTCFELFPNVLHFSPCRTKDAPFQSIIILPKDTNTPLEKSVDKDSVGEQRLLFMKNKWLIAHEERKPLLEKGAHPGIIGINHEILF